MTFNIYNSMELSGYHNTSLTIFKAEEVTDAATKDLDETCVSVVDYINSVADKLYKGTRIVTNVSKGLSNTISRQRLTENFDYEGKRKWVPLVWLEVNYPADKINTMLMAALQRDLRK